MKRLLNILILLVSFVIASNAQTVDFNENKDLQLKEVIQTPDLTVKQVFVSVQSLLSDWHPNTNSKLSIDYSDLETGTIITKGKYFLGFHKSNMLCGYDVYADFTCTVRMKEGRTQVVVKVPSVTLHWTANNTEDETVAVSHVYPKYDGYKTRLYLTKKPLIEFGPKIPDGMRSLFKSIQDKLLYFSNDDF